MMKKSSKFFYNSNKFLKSSNSNVENSNITNNNIEIANNTNAIKPEITNKFISPKNKSKSNNEFRGVISPMSNKDSKEKDENYGEGLYNIYHDKRKRFVEYLKNLVIKMNFKTKTFFLAVKYLDVITHSDKFLKGNYFTKDIDNLIVAALVVASKLFIYNNNFQNVFR